jgi:hypothetical protein
MTESTSRACQLLNVAARGASARPVPDLGEISY